ncbi:MAG: hypothetical protein SPI20_02960, partial [Ruminococcus callidus]|nr:hypothetical protein [Ruminococcus sp.]MDD6946211.1 hypothetical protein [Ruminococcus sp.]MDY6144647.1 hypothetical protein [Ruminococcus callidus]
PLIYSPFIISIPTAWLLLFVVQAIENMTRSSYFLLVTLYNIIFSLSMGVQFIPHFRSEELLAMLQKVKRKSYKTFSYGFSKK